MGSSPRRFAMFPDQPACACRLGSSISVDSIRSKNNSCATGSLLLPLEPGISRFRRPLGNFCPSRELAGRAKLSLPTRSPCIVANRNPKEWNP